MGARNWNTVSHVRTLISVLQSGRKYWYYSKTARTTSFVRPNIIYIQPSPDITELFVGGKNDTTWRVMLCPYVKGQRLFGDSIPFNVCSDLAAEMGRRMFLS